MAKSIILFVMTSIVIGGAVVLSDTHGGIAEGMWMLATGLAAALATKMLD